MVFSGLGTTAGDQPALHETQRTALISYWTAICKASSAVACHVNDELRTTPPSRSVIPIPVVPVPNVASARGPNGTVTVTIPADTLGFSANSSALGPGADAVLTPVVARARRQDLLVSVTGHSVQIKSEPTTDGLSLARAWAVAKRLIQLGLPQRRLLKVRGVGASADPPYAAYTDGVFDEAKAEILRRVVIRLLPSTVR